MASSLLLFVFVHKQNFATDQYFQSIRWVLLLVLIEIIGLPSIRFVGSNWLLQVLLLKHLIDYLAEDKDEELKEFVKDFLNPNSLVSLAWLGIFSFKESVHMNYMIVEAK